MEEYNIMPKYENTTNNHISDGDDLFPPGEITPCAGYHNREGLVLVDDSDRPVPFNVLYIGSGEIGADVPLRIANLGKYKQLLVVNRTGAVVQMRANGAGGDWDRIFNLSMPLFKLNDGDGNKWNFVEFKGKGANDLKVVGYY